MDNKWDRFKGKISNIFFEEIEEIEEDEKETTTIDRKNALSKSRVEKKSFRFPVIPDEHGSQHSEKQNKPFIPARMQQTERNTRKRPPKRPYPETIDNYQMYQRHKQLKEMEDVPAYLRREVTQEQPNVKSNIKENINDSLHKRHDEEKFLNQSKQKERTSHTSQFSAPSYQRSEMKSKVNTKSDHEQNWQNKKENLEGSSSSSHLKNLHKERKPTRHHRNPIELLADPVTENTDDREWIQQQQMLLEQALSNFNIAAKVVHVTQGPSVTRFEIQPELGVKVSKIRNLADDLKLNLAAKEIRIEAPIPGRNTVGIEVPNQYPQMVTLKEIIETDAFHRHPSPLTIALGLTIEGDPLITDIEKMPHGLIAGATGSGKSVCINTILISLMYKSHHDDVKFLLIDPKMVELAPYNGIPHLISPVITDAKAATAALKWAVNEMESRYEKFVQAGVRNLEKFNEKVMNREWDDEKIPSLVIVIDELADLMMVSPQDVEDSISRIAQKARAAGIHLLLATQRPSVDVITGLIKANIPSRIAFTVSSQVDSRTILDSIGAEKLLGKGDMLFIENGSGKSLRLQGPFVSDEEINRVTDYMKSLATPTYFFEQEQLLTVADSDDEDELLSEVITFVVQNNQASTSLLQRQFRIGYNRAARLVDLLYDRGIIGGPNGSKPREVLMTESQLEDYFKTK